VHFLVSEKYMEENELRI